MSMLKNFNDNPEFNRQLEYAKEGLQQFKSFIGKISKVVDLEEFRESSYFEPLLGIFLGLKPLSIGELEDQFVAIINYFPSHIKFYDGYIYNVDALNNTLEQYKSELQLSNTDTSNPQVFFPQLIEPGEKYDLRRGLLFGYPHDSVVNYTTSSIWSEFLFYHINDGTILSEEKKKEVKEHISFGLQEQSFELYEDYFIEVFRLLGINFTQDEFQILYRRQTGNLLGIGSFVWVGKTSEKDFYYGEFVNTIFRQSGAHDYLFQNRKRLEDFFPNQENS